MIADQFDFRTVRRFVEVDVVPYSEDASPMLAGGPVWPDFMSRTWERHIRDGLPVDIASVYPAVPVMLAGPWSWVGPIARTRGDQYSEFSSRMLAARLEHDSVGVVTSRLRTGREETPTWFAELLEWFGLADRALHVASDPVTCAELLVSPQGEPCGASPLPGYVDELRAHQDSQLDLLKADVPEFAYAASVTERHRLAGDGFLARSYARDGWAILRPESDDLLSQLRQFSNGSTLLAPLAAPPALHLLGELMTDFHVLALRSETDPASEALQARGYETEFFGVPGMQLHALPWARSRRTLTVADAQNVEAVLAERKLLPRAWSVERFGAETVRDLAGFIAIQSRHVPDYPSARLHEAFAQWREAARLLSKSNRGLVMGLIDEVEKRVPPAPDESELARPLTATDERIAQFVPGKSFIDVGALWGTVNERASVAARAGASRVAIADIQPLDRQAWRDMDRHLGTRGVEDYSKIVVDAAAPDAPARIGVHDVVHCSGLIYHLPNPMRLIENLLRCTREYLILTSMVIPDRLETAQGSWDASCAPIFVPSLAGRLYDLVNEHFQRLNLHVMGITASPPREWYQDDGAANTAAWWWLLSPSVLKGMLTAGGFAVFDEFWLWEQRSYTVVARPAAKAGG